MRKNLPANVGEVRDTGSSLGRGKTSGVRAWQIHLYSALRKFMNNIRIGQSAVCVIKEWTKNYGT